jgi:hypothetical protein
MKRLAQGKKGNMSLGDVPKIALVLIFTAAIFVGGYLVLVGLGTAGADGDGNASTTSSAELAVGNMTDALDNIVTYAPTWGTIVGVSVLIGIVIFGFAYAGKRGYL